MTIHDDRDFLQLTGAFDRPVAPSPAFTDRLRNRMGNPAAASLPKAAPPIHAGAQVKPIPVITPRSRRRWLQHLDVAAAIVIVFAVVGAALQLQQPDAPNQLAFQPSSATEINYAGSSGRSWYFGEQDIEADDSWELPLDLGSGEFLVDPPLRTGNQMVIQTFDGEATFLTKVSLPEATVLWRVPAPSAIHGAFASNGELVFGMGVGTNYRPIPLALSLETGELAWTGEPLELGNDSILTGPVVASGIVYFSDQLGNVRALDAESGIERWHSPETFLQAPVFEEWETSGLSPLAEVSVMDNRVFIQRPSMSIDILDSTTGEQLGSIPLKDEYVPDVSAAVMEAAPGYLAVIARSPLLDSAPGAVQHMRARVLVFNTESFDLVMDVGMVEFRGSMAVSPDAVYFAGRVNAAEGADFDPSKPYLLSAEYASGQVKALISLDFTVRWPNLSLSGHSVNVITDTLILIWDGSSGTVTTLDNWAGAGAIAAGTWDSSLVYWSQSGIWFTRDSGSPQSVGTPIN
jgi:outer membrane protein assembly factor BamB